jgi:hypothetical protein
MNRGPTARGWGNDRLIVNPGGRSSPLLNALVNAVDSDGHDRAASLEQIDLFHQPELANRLTGF